MKTGRCKQALVLGAEQRAQLEGITLSRSLPHGIVSRSRVVLLASEGISNTEISKRLRLSRPTVGIWRQRFLDFGIEGLHEELR